MIKINGKEDSYNVIHFPSGEIGVDLKEIAPYRPLSVYAEVVTPNDIMELALVLNVLQKKSTTGIILELPYVPFGRQDRHTTPESAFSLKVFADILNSFNLKEVQIQTMHSNVTEFLINNCVPLEPSIEFEVYTEDFNAKDTIIIAPDAGAEKRAYMMAEAAGFSDVFVCSKRRNASTGDIIGMTCPVLPEGKHMIVVDDICDGGRTFIELAKVLPERLSLTLFVTHGIFSKGRKVLYDAGYDYVHAEYNFIEERLNASN